LRIAWAPEARQDRFEIWAWIAADDPYAAARMDERIGESAGRLADHPELGRKGLTPGTRELAVHESYRIVYEIDARGEIVRILAVVHSHRQWPPLGSG